MKLILQVDDLLLFHAGSCRLSWSNLCCYK